MKMYNTHLVYNLDLSKYWKSGIGWIEDPKKASRYSKGDAEFILNLIKNPQEGDLESYEMEVRTFRVMIEIIFEKLEKI